MPPSPAKPKNDRRLAAERQGRRAEALAALWLQAQLYSIRERRLKTPVGEIDLIAERFGTTVFVEVKARGAREDVAEALGKVNRQRLVRAAQYRLRNTAEALPLGRVSAWPGKAMRRVDLWRSLR